MLPASGRHCRGRSFAKQGGSRYLIRARIRTGQCENLSRKRQRLLRFAEISTAPSLLVEMLETETKTNGEREDE
jgi:hypothetical protein